MIDKFDGVGSFGTALEERTLERNLRNSCLKKEKEDEDYEIKILSKKFQHGENFCPYQNERQKEGTRKRD